MLSCLGTATDLFNVARQAYYGGTFVGNHTQVHTRRVQLKYTYRLIQTQNIRSLCSAPLVQAQQHFPHLIPDCEAIRDRFEPLFALFSRCHSIFDQSEVHDLDNLGIK